MIRLWEPSHGEVLARPRPGHQSPQPGTRAYLSAGLPGAGWWVAGAACQRGGRRRRAGRGRAALHRARSLEHPGMRICWDRRRAVTFAAPRNTFVVAVQQGRWEFVEPACPSRRAEHEDTPRRPTLVQTPPGAQLRLYQLVELGFDSLSVEAQREDRSKGSSLGVASVMIAGVDVDELQRALGGIVVEAAYMERVLRAVFSALVGSKYAAVVSGRLVASALIEDCERITGYRTGDCPPRERCGARRAAGLPRGKQETQPGDPRHLGHAPRQCDGHAA